MGRAGANVSGVRDDCGVSDNVSAVLRYVGVTGQSVNIGTDDRDRWQGPVVVTRGVCKINDHNSVVSFGVLPGGYTGKTCVQVWIQDRTDRIDSVDVRLNKSDYGWTAKVTGSCRGR